MIDFDTNEEITFNVLSSSIHKHLTKPIRLSQLKDIFN
jgi:hypothetical protein